MPVSVALIPNGIGAWPDLDAKQKAGKLVEFAEDGAITFAAMPKVTAAGRSAVCIRSDLPDGQTLVTWVTLRNFLTIADALVALFPDEAAHLLGAQAWSARADAQAMVVTFAQDDPSDRGEGG